MGCSWENMDSRERAKDRVGGNDRLSPGSGGEAKKREVLKIGS